MWRGARFASVPLALGLPEVSGARCRALRWPAPSDNARVRFYLFTLKGYAYLSLRLDDDRWRHATRWPCCATWTRTTAWAASLIEAVRQRALVGTPDDDAPSPAAVFGAAAWARLAPA